MPQAAGLAQPSRRRARRWRSGAHWSPPPPLLGPSAPHSGARSPAESRGPRLDAQGAGRGAPTARRWSRAGARAAVARRVGVLLARAAAAASACCSARAACSRLSAPARRLPSSHGWRGAGGVVSQPRTRVPHPDSPGKRGRGRRGPGRHPTGRVSGDSEVLCVEAAPEGVPV